MRVSELFASFQGEGVHTGLPTTFVRLAGCSLGCSWCDTRYSSDPSSGHPMTIDEVVSEVKGNGLPLVCVTGGEPLEQDGCITLLESLVGEGFSVDLETNGAMDLGPVVRRAGSVFLSVDVKTPSSGACGSFLNDNLKHLKDRGQLKFVVKDGADLDFTMAFLKEHGAPTDIIITPCGNLGGAFIAGMLIEELRALGPEHHGLKDRLRLMVQTQKVIWGHSTRGV